MLAISNTLALTGGTAALVEAPSTATIPPTATHLAYLSAYHAFMHLGRQEVTGDGTCFYVGVRRRNDNCGRAVDLHDLLFLTGHHHHLLHCQAGTHNPRQLCHDVWKPTTPCHAPIRYNFFCHASFVEGASKEPWRKGWSMQGWNVWIEASGDPSVISPILMESQGAQQTDRYDRCSQSFAPNTLSDMAAGKQHFNF